MPLTLDEASAIFERRRASWLAADFDTYLDCFGENLVIELPTREPIHGREAYAKVARRSLEFTEPRDFMFHHIAVSGDIVLAEWTISVSRRDTGAVVSWDGMSVCTIVDGRITWWREYYADPDALARAMR